MVGGFAFHGKYQLVLCLLSALTLLVIARFQENLGLSQKCADPISLGSNVFVVRRYQLVCTAVANETKLNQFCTQFPHRYFLYISPLLIEHLGVFLGNFCLCSTQKNFHVGLVLVDLFVWPFYTRIVLQPLQT